VDEQLVIRLSQPLSEADVARLETDFAAILVPGGGMRLSDALDAESDETDIIELPRLLVDFNNRDFGRLRQLVDAINAC
jgi:hypothetical protein